MLDSISMTSPAFIQKRENEIKLSESNIEIYSRNNLSIEKLIEHVSNQPQKGFLKLDKNNEIYLKDKLTLGILTGKHKIRQSKLPENIKNLGVDLKFGNMTSRENIISKLEKQKEENNKGIEMHEAMIKTNKLRIAETKENQLKNSPGVLQSQKEEIAAAPKAEREEKLPDSNRNKICADGSPKPTLKTRTIKADGTPIPKNRTDGIVKHSAQFRADTPSPLPSPSLSIGESDSYPDATGSSAFMPPSAPIARPAPPPKPPRKYFSAEPSGIAQDTTKNDIGRQRILDLVKRYEQTVNDRTNLANG